MVENDLFQKKTMLSTLRAVMQWVSTYRESRRNRNSYIKHNDLCSKRGGYGYRVERCTENTSSTTSKGRVECKLSM
jgi:hypothetical protein